MKVENEKFGKIFESIDEYIFNELFNTKIETSTPASQTQSESFILSLASKFCNRAEGNIIEIGSLHGGSAEIILKNKPNNKKFFVCDTFSGFKDVSPIDETKLKNGDYNIPIEKFSKIIKSHSDTIIKQGYFPDDFIEYFKNEIFCFVHLDVDTYESTLKSLNFLHNKMSKNSLIIIHDYKVHLNGVTKAVDQFCSEKNIENYYINSNSNCQTIIQYA